uniref:Uncharacterized protein n=1 Tax=Oryzias sinensis TaxID=183150 RepID=A0A8C7YEK7_9TELE
MPAVSKGDGMRGLAVFISDIRNCKCCGALGRAVQSLTPPRLGDLIIHQPMPKRKGLPFLKM